MNLGGRVEAERLARKWSQEELAGRVRRLGGDISQTGIDKIEKRDAKRPRCLPELAAALDVSESWLLTGEGGKVRNQASAMVQLVGYVGAGAAATYFSLADNPDEQVPMPPGGTDKTVAVEIRGTSLGPVFQTRTRHPTLTQGQGYLRGKPRGNQFRLS